jgi:hypothetical protein
MSEIKSYEIPDTKNVHSMTVESARQQINQLEAAWAGDPDHPLGDHGHPQHGDFVKLRDRLYDVTRRGMDLRPEDEKILEAAVAKGQDRLAAKRDELIGQAEAEMEKLVELGFNHDEIPDDIQPFQVTALKMQRLNAEQNFEELVPMLEKELTTLRFSGMDTFRGFIRDSSIGSEERAEHIELILKRIYQANKTQAEKQGSLGRT